MPQEHRLLLVTLPATGNPGGPPLQGRTMDKTKLRHADLKHVSDVDAWIAAYGHSQDHAAHSLRDFLDAHPMMAATKRRAIEKWLQGYERELAAQSKAGVNGAELPPSATQPRVVRAVMPIGTVSLAKWALAISVATALSQVVEWVFVAH